MERRQALANIAAFVAGGMIDPERLIWVPGGRTIFLPPAASFLDIHINVHALQAWEDLFAPGDICTFGASNRLWRIERVSGTGVDLRGLDTVEGYPRSPTGLHISADREFIKKNKSLYFHPDDFDPYRDMYGVFAAVRPGDDV